MKTAVEIERKRPAMPSTTLEHDWSLFAPLEAVTQVFS
jgi:hypothetical protein